METFCLGKQVPEQLSNLNDKTLNYSEFQENYIPHQSLICLRKKE